MTFDITDKELRVAKRMLRRNAVRNLRALDYKLDKLDHKIHTTYKGIGDLIGGGIALIGGIIFALGISSADSIPNEWMDIWAFTMICSVAAVALGIKILDWMRS